MTWISYKSRPDPKLQRIKIRVVKVGGSLFDLPDLRGALARWTARQSPANNVLIAGGGPLVDLIRKVDQPLRLDAEKVHWACISVLAASARLMAALLPEANLIESYAVLRRQVERSDTGLFVFSVERFLRIQEESAGGLKLPYG
ncbi:MAG: hypothetical protein ACC628_12705, partial [Pirellulaceae bacterium]